MAEIPQNQIKIMPKNLPNIGVCETQLPRNVIDNFWDLIEEAKKNPQDMKSELAGNIKSSLVLDVQSPLLKDFYSYVLPTLIDTHLKSFGSPWRINFNPEVDTLNLFKLWVNFQKQNEFNPAHCHGGIYSFVIWLKCPSPATFQFTYPNTLGGLNHLAYNTDSSYENMMILYPAQFLHQVYPFYESNEERVSIAGNIGIRQI